MFMKKTLTALALALTTLLWTYCKDSSSLENDMDSLSARLDSLEAFGSKANDNAIAIRKFAKGNILIVGMTTKDHGYVLELSDGTSVGVTYGKDAPAIVPVIGIDKDGN